MRIGICVPTRGLVYTESLVALDKERQGYDTKLYLSHNQPIPNGHNNLCIQALADGAQFILLIEEDVVIPAGAIEKLLAVTSDVACIDYGVSGWGCVTRDQAGEILWCGLGCTLIKREVFEALEKPYFRADMVLDLPDFKWRQLPEEYVRTKNYGSLDIWFCTKALEAGFKIKQVVGAECRHLQLLELGQKGRNYGTHDIRDRERISKHQILRR